jgi:hypothetical protein
MDTPYNCILLAGTGTWVYYYLAYNACGNSNGKSHMFDKLAKEGNHFPNSRVRDYCLARRIRAFQRL